MFSGGEIKGLELVQRLGQGVNHISGERCRDKGGLGKGVRDCVSVAWWSIVTMGMVVLWCCVWRYRDQQRYCMKSGVAGGKIV